MQLRLGHIIYWTPLWEGQGRSRREARAANNLERQMHDGSKLADLMLSGDFGCKAPIADLMLLLDERVSY